MAKTKDSDSTAIAPDGMGSLGDAVGLAAGETVCQVMGKNEILSHEIVVKRTDEVIWRIFLCNAPAVARLRIADGLGHHNDLVNQKIPPPNPLTAVVARPPVSPPRGRYVLIWALSPPPPAGTDWQMVVEVLVNEVAVFRQYKSAKSQFPDPRGFLFMEVQ
jgi:hypothetical protein